MSEENLNAAPEAVEIEDAGIDFETLPSEVSLIDEGTHNFLITDIKLKQTHDTKKGIMVTTRSYTLKITDDNDAQNGKTIIDNLIVGNEFSDVRQKNLILSAYGDTTPPKKVSKDDLLGKIVCAEVVHNQGKGQNAGKKFANIKAYYKNKPSGSSTPSNNSL